MHAKLCGKRERVSYINVVPTQSSSRTLTDTMVVVRLEACWLAHESELTRCCCESAYVTRKHTIIVIRDDRSRSAQ